MSNKKKYVVSSRLYETIRIECSRLMKERFVSIETRQRSSLSHLGYKMPDFQKQKISLALFGKKKSLQHKKNISKSKQGVNNPGYGKRRTDEVKNQIRATLRIKSPFKKAIYRIDLDGNVVRFDSIMEAERQTSGANNSKIVMCLKGKRKTHRGFAWEYALLNLEEKKDKND